MKLTVSQRVEKIRSETSGVQAQSGIDSWTDTFLTSISTRSSLTPKQESKLREVEVSIFGRDYDPHTGDLFA